MKVIRYLTYNVKSNFLKMFLSFTLNGILNRTTLVYTYIVCKYYLITD